MEICLLIHLSGLFVLRDLCVLWRFIAPLFAALRDMFLPWRWSIANALLAAGKRLWLRAPFLWALTWVRFDR